MAAGAIPWAGALIICGLWLCLSGPRQWPMFARPMFSGGVTALAMGQFVLSSLVGDTVFPGIGRRIAWWFEGFLLCAIVAGMATTAALLAMEDSP